MLLNQFHCSFYFCNSMIKALTKFAPQLLVFAPYSSVVVKAISVYHKTSAGK